MSTQPFSPGPEGAVIRGEELKLSGGGLIHDVEGDELELARGARARVMVVGELTKVAEVEKSEQGVPYTVREWTLKVDGMSAFLVTEAPAPRKRADGAGPGQQTLDGATVGEGGRISPEGEESVLDAAAAAINAGELDTEGVKATAEVTPADAEAAADVAEEALEAGVDETLAEIAATEATADELEAAGVVYVVPGTGEAIESGTRWLHASLGEVEVTGCEGDTLKLKLLGPGGGVAEVPVQAIGSDLARADVVAEAVAADPGRGHDPAAAALEPDPEFGLEGDPAAGGGPADQPAEAEGELEPEPAPVE